MLETYGTEHNVRTFVSLSSPQGGQYGGKYFDITVESRLTFTLCYSSSVTAKKKDN